MFKHSKSLKATIFGLQPNQVQVRLVNLDDRFDGANNSQVQTMDLNAFARELYMEANAHLLSKNATLAEDQIKLLQVNITEMNLAGSIPLTLMKQRNKFAKWKTPTSEDP